MTMLLQTYALSEGPLPVLANRVQRIDAAAYDPIRCVGFAASCWSRDLGPGYAVRHVWHSSKLSRRLCAAMRMQMRCSHTTGRARPRSGRPVCLGGVALIAWPISHLQCVLQWLPRVCFRPSAPSRQPYDWQVAELEPNCYVFFSVASCPTTNNHDQLLLWPFFTSCS